MVMAAQRLAVKELNHYCELDLEVSQGLSPEVGGIYGATEWVGSLASQPSGSWW